VSDAGDGEVAQAVAKKRLVINNRVARRDAGMFGNIIIVDIQTWALVTEQTRLRACAIL